MTPIDREAEAPSAPDDLIIGPPVVSRSAMRAAQAVLHRLNGALNNCILSLEVLAAEGEVRADGKGPPNGEGRADGAGRADGNDGASRAMADRSIAGARQARCLMEILGQIVQQQLQGPRHGSDDCGAVAREILMMYASQQGVQVMDMNETASACEPDTAARALVRGFAALEDVQAGATIPLTFDVAGGDSVQTRA